MLIGNVTRDPEVRTTPKGVQVGQFGLAVNREFKTESGEKREEVFFADIEVWGKLAEVIGKYVTKGKLLYVEGRCRMDQWEDKNTKEKRSRMKVVLEQFQFLGGGRDSSQQSGGGDGSAGAQQDRGPAPAHSNPPPSRQEDLDEDVPF